MLSHNHPQDNQKCNLAMADSILGVYRTGSHSDAGFGSSVQGSSFSSTGRGTGTGASLSGRTSTGSRSGSGLGFFQSLTQWVYVNLINLNPATLSSNLLSAWARFYLVGLLSIAAIGALAKVCRVLVSALLMDPDGEITAPPVATQRNAVLPVQQIKRR